MGTEGIMTDQAAGLAQKDWRATLRTVGTVLIIVGVLDIGYMVYCIVTRQSYSSSFNIFAVIAGVLLRRGSLRTAWGTAFYAAALMCPGLLLPLLLVVVPRDLILTYVRLHPLGAVAAAGAVLAMFAFLVWTYRRLTSPAVLAAMEEHGIRCRRGFRRPALGFVIGGVIAVAVLLMVALIVPPYRQQAETRAAAELGDDYKYFVVGFGSVSTGSERIFSADVLAYNHDEIKKVTLTWKE